MKQTKKGKCIIQNEAKEICLSWFQFDVIRFLGTMRIAEEYLTIMFHIFLFFHKWTLLIVF